MYLLFIFVCVTHFKTSFFFTSTIVSTYSTGVVIFVHMSLVGTTRNCQFCRTFKPRNSNLRMYDSLPESHRNKFRLPTTISTNHKTNLSYFLFLSYWLSGRLLYESMHMRKLSRSSRLKVLCVNVVHEHLHYTDLNHSAVEQYNRRSHSGGTAATAVSKVLEKKSHCWLFLRNSPDIWVGFFLLGSLDFMNVMNKKLQLCERPTVHVVHYTK